MRSHTPKGRQNSPDPANRPDVNSNGYTAMPFTPDGFPASNLPSIRNKSPQSITTTPNGGTPKHANGGRRGSDFSYYTAQETGRSISRPAPLLHRDSPMSNRSQRFPEDFVEPHAEVVLDRTQPAVSPTGNNTHTLASPSSQVEPVPVPIARSTGRKKDMGSARHRPSELNVSDVNTPSLMSPFLSEQYYGKGVTSASSMRSMISSKSPKMRNGSQSPRRTGSVSPRRQGSQSPVRSSTRRRDPLPMSQLYEVSDSDPDDAAPAGPNSKRKPKRRTSIDISNEPEPVVAGRKVWNSTDPSPLRRSGSKSRMDKAGVPSKNPGLKSTNSLTPKEIQDKSKGGGEGKDVDGGYKWDPGKSARLKVLGMDKSKYDDDGVEGTDEDGPPVLAEEEGVDTIVELNCGGIRFESRIKTLRKHPQTLIGQMADQGGDLFETGYAFFDRDPMAFNYILNFYRYDRLVMPSFMSDDQWAQELDFYGIDNPDYKIPTEEELDADQIKLGKPRMAGWRRSLWMILEDPASGNIARIVSILSILIILFGVTCFILETHPVIRLSSTDKNKKFSGLTVSTWRFFFSMSEGMVVGFFTVELLLRFICNTKKKAFCIKIPNIIDFISVFPYYVDLIPGVQSTSATLVLRALRLIRVIRVIGLVLKLGRYSAGARVLATTVASCARELSVLMVLLIIDSILIASAVFFCENPNVLIEDSDFDSIMTSMYFAIITVTTVGYGDYSPTTVCGECVACFGALSGVFVLGLPISIIGVKFQERYYDMLREIRVQEERIRLLAVDKKMQAVRALQALGDKILGHGFDKDKMTPKDREKIQRLTLAVFKEVDSDNSGMIDKDEMGVAMIKLGCELPDDVLDDMMKEMDTDETGTVDAEEFCAFIGRVIRGDLPDAMAVQAEMGGPKKKDEGHKAFIRF